MARFRVCGLPWAVCPNCMGEQLESIDERYTCPRCGRSWARSERDPCPDAATVLLGNAPGVVAEPQSQAVCMSHAATKVCAELTRLGWAPMVK